MQTQQPEHQIDIAVEPVYLEEESSPEKERFVFAYTVTVRNLGSVPARLMTRHWIITDASGKVQEVKGDGVVGEQPHLAPGEGFRYTSATVIETPPGNMRGSYQMVADDGAEFDADIPAFSLSLPHSLH